IDANVWLFIHGPASIPSNPVVQAYAAIFSKLLLAGVRPVLDVLVLGEFINRYARIEYERADPPNATGKRVYRNFKKFRESPGFAAVATDIANQCTPVVNLCRCIDHNFSEWDIPALLRDFSTGAFDCIDQLLV